MNFSELAKIPMWDEHDIRMVEIVVLKFNSPAVETRCATAIIQNTDWPFKLTVYDNRRNTPNTARIWNKLIGQATCDCICLMDSDGFVPKTKPCWLTRMMESFQHPDCRLVVPVTNRCTTPQQLIPVRPYPSDIRDDRIWSGPCFLIRRELLQEIGPFDEEFVGYGCDSEFAFRLAKAGGATYLRRDVFVEHVHGASFKTGAYDAEADRAYARDLYVRKTAGGQ